MNRKEHDQAGMFVGGLVALTLDTIIQQREISQGTRTKIDIGRLLARTAMGSSAGLLVSRLPDILEPAFCPHHRSFFHSIGFGTALIYGLNKLDEKAVPDNSTRHMIKTGGCAYLSHLLLDATTPYSLPLL